MISSSYSRRIIKFESFPPKQTNTCRIFADPFLITSPFLKSLALRSTCQFSADTHLRSKYIGIGGEDLPIVLGQRRDKIVLGQNKTKNKTKSSQGPQRSKRW